MKTKMITLGLLAFAALVFQGCVAFPPLIQVEHKESATNQEVLKRLDAIDNRLNQLEQKEQPKPTP